MRFVKESVIRAAQERVWAFHALPDAIDRLVPPFENARIIKRAASLRVGEEAIIETRIFNLFPVRWVARHTLYEPPHVFEDIQLRGPFARWRHRHIINPHAEGAMLRDEIEYEPPFGFVGKIVAPYLIVPRMQKMFDYRHEVTKKWCENKVSQTL